MNQSTSKGVLTAFCFSILAAVGASTAVAQTDGLRSGLYESSLIFFREQPENLMLRNSTAFDHISIPISPRLQVRSARLHLEYTSSIALLEGRSQLRISLGDKILTQLPLRPREPHGVVEIGLPVDLLEADYNPLTFWVAQHYTLQCEDPTAPELWTQIDVHNSYLVLDAELRPLAPTLAELDDLIDRRLWGPFRWTLVTAGDEPRDPQLHWGSLIAQGAAVRLRYKPVEIEHARAVARAATPETEGWSFPGLDQSLLPSRDLALVGTRDELAPYLSSDLAARIGDSFLGIFPLDSDPRYFVLVVSGTTDEEVERAARAFSLAHQLPLPDSRTTRIHEELIPPFPDRTAHHAIRDNRLYTFSDFGFETETLTGISPGSFGLQLWVPPDFFTRQTTAIELSLHFAYGAALRSDSVFNIFLNRRFENVIYLRDREGEVFRDYRVQIPVRSFRPGLNTLSFLPQMFPLITGECQAVQDRNLVFTLFEDSQIRVPATAHFVEMPDLERFATTTFPFGTDGKGTDMGLLVLSTDAATVGAAWTLMGKLAQVRSLPLWEARITTGRPEEDRDRNWLLIGAVGDLVPASLQGSPVGVGNVLRVPYPTLISEQPPTEPRGLFGFLWDRLRTLVTTPKVENRPLRPEVVTLTQSGGLGRFGLLMEYASPWSSGLTVGVITADSPERLHQRVRQLVDPGIWDNLGGDVALWEDRAASLRKVDVGPRFQVGTISLSQRLEYSFSTHPWFWAVLLLVVMVVFALAALYLLRRYREREHQRFEIEGREVLVVGEAEAEKPGPEGDRHE